MAVITLSSDSHQRDFSSLTPAATTDWVTGGFRPPGERRRVALRLLNAQPSGSNASEFR